MTLTKAPLTHPTMKTAPEHQDFQTITEWVFDLDNTLYPHHSDLFSQIDVKMTSYVANLLQLPREEARVIQKDFYKQYGTTLAGLIKHHAIDSDDFLEKVHDIDYSWLDPDPALGDMIGKLPGRKMIFTNGDTGHAKRTAEQLGILHHFDEIFDIVAADLVPKPAQATYDKFASLHRVDTKNAIMFEDLARNLLVPKMLGMKTVLIVPHNFEATFTESWEQGDGAVDHIDYVTDDLKSFLGKVIATLET